ncbi:DUF4184 family protein [Paenibacillus sp. FSL H7-0331]|uniref:DUF4184 family protein n=1 Tax=Paenibacillus sp. FSL H7-0331 TaxID=1920421 RepID=UPI0015C331A2|nr:DUF4184 family protein [Paenibacillus sp. FSL H7-0331]
MDLADNPALANIFGVDYQFFTGSDFLPFTFAHPLYSFPIKFIKPRYFSLSGLILGSMSPDYEYFIALEPYQTIGHTHKGLLLQGLPLCVVILFLLHLIRKPLILHLPSMFHIDVKAYQLIRSFDFRDIKNWIVFLLSVVIGFYSHIFLDAFTHKSGYFVMNYPLLQNIYFSVPLYKLLQHILSLIGMLAQILLIVWLLIKTPFSTKNFREIGPKRKIIYWFIVLIIAIVVVIAKLYFASSTNILGMIIVSSISGLFLGLVVASLIFRKRLRYR